MRRVGLLTAVVAILVWSFPEPSRGEIFRYTAPDGTVSFTNVAVDKRYRPFAVSPDVPFSKLRSTRTYGRAHFTRLIDDTAREYEMDPALVHAVIKAESDYDPRAISSAGALGLMQLMPGTAQDLNVADPFDPGENVRGGVQYLRYLLDRFEGNVPFAVAAYHAGEQNVDRHGGIPPIVATQDYVKRVMTFHKRNQGKRPTAAKAIYRVKSGDTVIYTTNPPVSVTR